MGVGFQTFEFFAGQCKCRPFSHDQALVGMVANSVPNPLPELAVC